ncbi:E3 ubiquitin/ISG15 ligase TRIM25-like [Aulostomus maculatus]
MALKGVQLDREMFSCSICLELLRDPVTIPCGHNYCMSCIQGYWDDKNVYSCPECRQVVTPRPVLVKNTMLSHLVEELKKTKPAASADNCYAGPEDVACDVCTGRKLKAFKSCLVCVASYCAEHLQPHFDAAPLKKHSLVQPSKKLQESICSHHDEVMKMFCRTDKQQICYLCSVEAHKGHDTVSAAAERSERQKELEVTRKTIKQKIQDKEKNINVLQNKMKAIDATADKAVEDSEKIFTELVRLVVKRGSDVKQQIRTQQTSEVKRVRELQVKLEKEITELKKSDSELQRLSNTLDHIQFLQIYPSLSQVGRSTESAGINIHLWYFENITAAVSETRDKLKNCLRETDQNISHTGNRVDTLLSQSEPKTRAEFLKYSRSIRLDSNTANAQLYLSEGNRAATIRNTVQCHSNHPERFSDWWQVLSKEPLTRRCYWEVEWRGEAACIAVAYGSISRTGTGNQCGFGYNNKSWALYVTKDSCEFMHNDLSSPVQGPRSSRVGVYLDHKRGVLSFYSVTESMTLLHRAKTTFTQPLHAGLYLYHIGDMAEFIHLK